MTIFKSVDFDAADEFVYKFSVQGNLYVARYEHLKFCLQGKFCGKITTADA